MKVSEKALFLDKLETVREEGFSSAEGEDHLGVRDYAVLVGNPRICLMAALAVPCLGQPNRNYSHAALLKALKACGQKITHSLGVSEP
ncbi:IclR family transcriptional regulator C-terminal domain-containing protein [Paenibacillus sp. GP183]|uniref:IclR family transcriptional regulator domain-containing protein n=1 Tax=Paenibacillus sp. GP183 TaxID=1882751 RepID=UPI000B85C40B|nr:IclR family transcriptional regulator C-terminal domain-containing protein [Paenibacillus sp. GP183]